VIANTKGMTGHAMGTGIEDVVAVKSLETGVVPPVANFKEIDPELGTLNLSKGGVYPVEYAIRLGAGFGSQISMTLLHWLAPKDGSRRRSSELGYAYRIVDDDCWRAWLSQVAGYPTADLEVVHRTLRVRDQRTADQRSVVRSAEIATKPNEIPVPALPRTPVPVVITAPLPQPSVAVEAKLEIIPPTLPAPAPARPAGTGDPVKDRVLALVAEKTGYPVDMLDLDLDLEADLGVDTVKQAEVMATIREAYGIARDDTIKLRDFPTLARVIQFVHDRRPDLRAPRSAPTPAVLPVPAIAVQREVPAASSAPDVVSAKAGDSVKERILALMVEKTGYPQDMLDLDLDLEADLGVDTVKQAEMFAAIREIYSIPRDENRKLRDYPTLAHVIRFVYEKRPDLAGAPAPSSSSPVSPSPVSITPTATEVVASVPTQLGTPSDFDDPIKEAVLRIVAEKTGYPEDMLDLDLDLEADLGVDTVKQAEMFAAVRAAYNIPRDENMKLRDFPTLAHVIKFAHDRSQTRVSDSGKLLKEEPAESRKQATAPPTIAAERPTLASFDAANAIPRRVPMPTLRPPLNVCKATGVKLERPSRVVIMPDRGGVSTALAERLRAAHLEVLQIDGTPDTETLQGLLGKWIAAGPIAGVYWLPALDGEGKLSDLDLSAWHEAVRVRVKSLYITMRALSDQIGENGTFFVAATRMGGHHGYDDAGAVSPLGGAVTGFTKAFKRERMECMVKAVDFETNRGPAAIADLLVAETQRDPGVMEVGYTGEQRWTIGLEEQPATDEQPGMVLDKNSVFVITGAAGSIVSAITADLAAASGGTFYLLDLVPKPDPDNPDLKRFMNDRENLKRDLFTRIQTRGERATPALVEKELASLEREQAAQSAIDAVRAAGGTPHYFSVNLTDAGAVAAVIDQVRQRSSRIDVLLHAAGIERSHFLPDKDPREFDLVFDVKSDGFFNLLHAIGEMPLGATVAFSSIAGRFGNAGQTDYSSANDLLCKITSSFLTTRPATRGIAIDWTAWGGIGMATRGSIPKIMELAGIDMLPPKAGIPLIRRELTAGATRGEIVIAQRLGLMLNEWNTTGGLDPASVEAGKNLQAIGPMGGKVASMSLYDGYSIETILNPAAQPFLHDHQIDGTPVLPGVMGIEGFAEAALCLLPGWQVEAIEDVSFLAPFKFYRSEPRVVRIETQIHPHEAWLIADCRLIGYRSLPNLKEPQATTHFTARVRLTKQPVPLRSAKAVVPPVGNCVEASDIYRLYFHGPAYQVLERAWWDGNHIIGLMAKALPPNHHPSDLETIVAPRLIELCFQTAGVWELGIQGRMGLPLRVDHVSLFHTPNVADARLYAVAIPDNVRGTFDVEVLDEKGNCYLRLSGYQTVALSDAVDKEGLKSLQATMSGKTVLVA
jgi:NAD(P)-dependent dehydrogenase (short-subunit alcohol dehydrogenase family)/acyl carrier protein